MIVTPPKIDKRNFQTLLEEAKRLAPFYVPEWNIASSDDSGVALLKIFFYMLQEVTHRLNEVPEKNFVAFLDMLGVKLVPAQPSNVPLTFKLATGATNVLVPELTQAEASATDKREALIFETEKNILATTTALTDIYSVVPTRDEIFEHSQNLTDSKSFELFVNHDQQEHALYLGHENLFNIKGKANIQLTISPFPEQLLNPRLVSWQYYGKKVEVIYGQEVESLGWYNFEFGEEFSGQITLVKNDVWEIIPYKINDIETRWIRCLLGVSVTIADYVPAGASSFEVDSILGITPGDQLQIADWETTDDTPKVEFITVTRTETTKAGPTVYIQEKLKYAHNKGVLVKRVRDVSKDWETINNLQINTITISTSPPDTGIGADLLFSNDVPLDLSKPPVYPFGKQPRLYDTFYIASQEAFSKKGAKITLNMEISRKQSGVSVRRVQGIGETFASRLEKGLLFSADLKFQGDLDNGSISDDLRRAFENNKFPLSQNVTISIEEKGSRWLITDEGNNRTYTIRKEGEQLNIYIEPIKTVEQLLQNTPSQLASILNTDETRAVNILEAARKEFHDKTPPLKETDDGTAPPEEDLLALSWEYWDGKGWKVIKNLTDNTDRLTKTGTFTVTFSCPEDIATTFVAGQENYWIRVRIVSGDYGREEVILLGEPPNQYLMPDRSSINPPVITRLQITYSLQEAFDLQHCLIHNNLEFQDVTQNSKTETELFQPFQPLPDEHQTLYLGFDKQLLKGPISLFFSLEEQRYPDENRPRVQWYYYSKADEWVRLEVVDDTDNLTRSGTIELLGPSDFAQTSLFGKKRYWLKAVDIEERFQPSQESVMVWQVVPDYAVQGERIDVTISGNNFQQGATVTFSGNGIKVAKDVEVISSSQLRVQIAVASDAPLSERDVTVTNPDGNQGIGKGLFQVEAVTLIKPCPEESQVFPLPFEPLGDFPPAPKIKGIYINSTWALQTATIRNEILGSSDGAQLQVFQFTQTPVFSETIQVNEIGSISEDDKQSLIETEGEEAISEVKNAAGNPTEIWVRWKKVDDFFDSKPESRHYIINRVSGEVQFGDGIHGMIPPIGKDNIRATYQSGGGKDGNVNASEIQTLKTSIPFVDKVNNPTPAGGGSNTETVEKVLERGPQFLRNRGRAVTFEDYEWLVKEASPDIARVKCLPNFNNEGTFEPGWVTVVLVPESSEEKPVPSPLLLKKVEEYLKDRCSNVLVSAKRLQVIGPDYIKVSVIADIYPISINLASDAEKKAIDALKAFLHPLTGGADKTGWEFGRMVCFSDLYALLEDIEEIDHVENVSMTLEGDEQKMTFTSENVVEISIPPYALIYSGEHALTPKLLTS